MKAYFGSVLVAFSPLVLMFGMLTGCQKADINNHEAVMTAVSKHIAARGDLGLGDLDIEVVKAEFDDDSCQAEVRFVPKGQSPDAGMTMHYTLERDGAAWKVKPKQNSGAGMDVPMSPHEPSTPEAPESPETEPGPQAGQSLPPGHPPVAPTAPAPR